MTTCKIDPYDYQIDDMNFLLNMKKGALLHEPGVGKTFGALLALSYVLETEGGTAVVVMPPMLLKTWYDKIYEYFDTSLKTLLYSGTVKQRENYDFGNYDIILVSFQILSRDYKRFKSIPKLTSLTVDESKYIKFGEVKKSKKTGRMNGFGNVQSLAHKTKYLTIMNGTPLTKSPEDVFHILQLINPGMYVTKKNFLRTHAIYATGDTGFPIIRGWKFLPALESRLDKVSRRMIKSDVLKDLPAKQLIIKQFDLDEAHLKNLKEMWEFGFLDLKGADTELLFLEGMALMMTIRRAMIEPSMVGITGKSRYFDVLGDLLDDLGTEQFIIFAHFHSTIDLLKEFLDGRKVSFTELHGRVSSKSKDQAVEDFKNKKIQALVANPKSAGVGLDFQQARNVIFFELDYEVDSFWQGQDRVHRPGQQQEVNIFAFVARNTPAVALLRAIKTNVNYVAEVLQGREDSSLLFDNRVTVEEETQWMKL
jgi:SNF2 family DNA or RNA helicase